MNISYNWLKEYVNFDLTPEQVAAALTSIGLETGEVEEVQSVKGGLEGLVIGKVLTCEPHPNSDHMHITTVDLGQGEPVQIVCGASNVAAGQKVVVATIGTKLYDGDGLRIERKCMSGGREIDRESVLSVGDKVTVSITVSADRDMDFVRIKDEKPACLEAASQLSSYSWSGGLGYYRVNKDASVEFFVDSMRKGTYTITYDAYVTRSGNYVSGPASVISVYAPQFGSHSEGFTMKVK